MEKVNLLNTTTQQNSNIEIINKSKIIANGVTNILSSNDTQINGNIGNDKFVISGASLVITRLDLDNKILEVDGSITSFNFNKHISFWKRFFK